MLIYITDKNEEHNIALRVWDNNENNGWSPDVFDDLADNLPRDYPVTDDMETSAQAAMTDAEYKQTVEWWLDEIGKYNARERSWFTEYLDDDEQDYEFSRNLEYCLFED